MSGRDKQQDTSDEAAAREDEELEHQRREERRRNKQEEEREKGGPLTVQPAETPEPYSDSMLPPVPETPEPEQAPPAKPRKGAKPVKLAKRRGGRGRPRLGRRGRKGRKGRRLGLVMGTCVGVGTVAVGGVLLLGGGGGGGGGGKAATVRSGAALPTLAEWARGADRDCATFEATVAPLNDRYREIRRPTRRNYIDYLRPYLVAHKERDEALATRRRPRQGAADIGELVRRARRQDVLGAQMLDEFEAADAATAPADVGRHDGNAQRINQTIQSGNPPIRALAKKLGLKVCGNGDGQPG